MPKTLGTALLVATVVGSGIMAQSLTTDTALALLGNTLPTGAILVVLITILGPISGAHFNPAVSLVFALRRELSWRDAALYTAAQILGGILGTIIAHAMFALPLVEASQHIRTGAPQWFAEAVAAFGLVAVILGGIQFQRSAVPWLVGLYITAAYWFTASTSFANPAVTIARALTDTFSGIRPADVPGFILAQLAGALIAWRCHGLAAAPHQRDRIMTITIYHNPDCGTSRNTLAMIRQSGTEPEIILYVENPPGREHLITMIYAAGLTVRQAIRIKDTPYDQLGLANPALTDGQLLDAMLAHPILINRPFVVTERGVRLCRPSELVLDILPNPDIGPFTKEDGEVIIDAEGKRLR